MKYSMLIPGIFIVIFVFQSSFSKAADLMSDMDWDIDRKGSDYNNFDLQTSDPTLCEDACANDPKCKAWTYLKPNTVQGPRPRCWLKHSIPPPEPNPNCVSGYKKS
jgi:hypothetical protein